MSVDVIQVGAIKGCTNIEPINVGKPAPFLLDYIIAKQTVLTLTGVTTIHTLLSDDNNNNNKHK